MSARSFIAHATAFLVGTLIFTAGCADKARPDYAKCVQAEIASDIGSAWAACSAAIAADPNSESGKAAATKLAALKPKYDALQKAEAERQAKAVAEKQRAEERATQALRAKIERYRTIDYEDDKCVAQGKPPLSYRYRGGTYAETDTVAYADGCAAFDDAAVRVEGHAQSHYCCPE